LHVGGHNSSLVSFTDPEPSRRLKLFPGRIVSAVSFLGSKKRRNKATPL
jgi:hypothetical protein